MNILKLLRYLREFTQGTGHSHVKLNKDIGFSLSKKQKKLKGALLSKGWMKDGT